MFIKFLAIFLIIHEIFAQSYCRTPFSEEGFCLPIRECSPIWSIVINAPKPLSRLTIGFLQNSTCGEPSEQKICCRLQDVDESEVNITVITKNQQDEDESSFDVLNHPNLNLVDTKNCGPISSDRIAHGNETVIFEFPWMALLGYEVDGGVIDWRCDGSVIHKRYVLTAAHCVANLRNKLHTVRLGEYDVSKKIDCTLVEPSAEVNTAPHCLPPVQDFSVEKVVQHPNFNKPKYANDIALIRLSKDADFSEFAVAPICLPVTEHLMSLELNKLIVTGWGNFIFTQFENLNTRYEMGKKTVFVCFCQQTNSPMNELQENWDLNTHILYPSSGTTENGHRSDKLLKAKINYITKESCEEILKIELSGGHICAGSEGMENSCSGDSGGPLQFPANINGDKFVQFGVVSFGYSSCGDTQAKPGVYADVRYYLKWILDNLKP